MKKVQIIGLAGVAGAGKTHVANILEDCGYLRTSFASPLKATVINLLAAAGIGLDAVRKYVHGDAKETPIPELGGVTSRHIQQTLGTEWGRDMIHPDLWVILARAQMQRIIQEGHSIVIDDVRFPNEVQMIHDMGGKVFRVVGGMPREGVPQHISEDASKVECDGGIINEPDNPVYTRSEIARAVYSTPFVAVH